MRRVPAGEFEILVAGDGAQEAIATPSVAGRALATIATGRNGRWGRRDRWLVAAAVAAAVAVGVTTDLVHDSRHVTAASTVRSVDQHTRVAATLIMTPQGAKTGLRLNLTGVAPGEHCSLIARTQDGRTEVTAAWVATYRGAAEIAATTALPATRVKGFDVVTTDGRVLVRLAVPPNR
ncbi:hypothetical protein [Kribbella sp. VKM Ac-2566]|uniref:hypothetical protein n=1 Tax=Kribbella sp. VKM Ac-2566 TaxID=2512218 RepID=UPI001416F2A5|nr:hypothetical protein [Kribbella sp. VKM Ac-2566]